MVPKSCITKKMVETLKKMGCLPSLSTGASDFATIHGMLLYQRSNKSGWWYTYPSEKYEFVTWDDYSIPNIWKVRNFMFQTTNQLN
jgi:hypothetical protein